MNFILSQNIIVDDFIKFLLKLNFKRFVNKLSLKNNKS